MGASLGTGNRGVSALGASLVNLLNEILPEVEPILLVGNRDKGPFESITGGVRRPVRVINYRLSPKAALSEQLFWIGFLALLYRLVPLSGFRRWVVSKNPWIRAVVEARLVGEICGGDSFSDIYGLQRFFLRSLPTVIVLLIRGDVVMFPQTYGPFKTTFARSMARWIMRRASMVLARDTESIDVARDLGARPERVRFCPDVAFTLPVGQVLVPEITPPLQDRCGRCLIGLNVSGLLFHGGYSRSNMFDLQLDYPAFVHNLVVTLLASPDREILLVPHTFAPRGRIESDNGASQDLLKELPAALAGRVHVVTRAYDQHDIKAVIGLCDFFVGSRMHACIAALSQGIPTVGVAYSRKFQGVFAALGLGDHVVDGRHVTAPAAVETIERLLADRATTSSLLQSRIPSLQRGIRSTFAELARASTPAHAVMEQEAFQL